MLSKMSVKKPFTVIVAVLIVIMLGVVSYINIDVDLLPSMNLPYIVVATIYPGAAPEEVEKDITNPVENSLAKVPNISSMESMSMEHVSVVILEFTSSTNVDSAYSDVNAALDLVAFPDSDLLQKPIVMKINPSLLPIMRISLSQENKSIKESNEYLTSIIEGLQGIDGVANVGTSGLISNLVYLSITTDKIGNALIKYIEDFIGAPLTLPAEVKDNLREELYLRVSANPDITSEELLDALVSALEDASNWATSNAPTEAGGIAETLVRLLIVPIINGIRTIDPVTQEVTYSADALSTAQTLLDNRNILLDKPESKQLFNNLCDQVLKEGISGVIEGQIGGLTSMLSPSLLQQLIFAQDFDMPAGNFSEGALEYIVKIGTTVNTRQELLDMPIMSFDVAETLRGYLDTIESLLSLLFYNNNGQYSFSQWELDAAANILYNFFNQEITPAPATGINTVTATAVANIIFAGFGTEVNKSLGNDRAALLTEYTAYLEQNAPSKWNNALTANWRAEAMDLFTAFLSGKQITLSPAAQTEYGALYDSVEVTGITAVYANAYVTVVDNSLPAATKAKLPQTWKTDLATIYMNEIPADWMIPAYSPTTDLVKQLLYIMAEENQWGVPNLETEIKTYADTTVLPDLSDVFALAFAQLDPETQAAIRAIFAPMSVTDVSNTIRGILTVLSLISPEGVKLPQPAADGTLPPDGVYSVDMRQLSADLEKMGKIPFNLSTIADIIFFDDAAKQSAVLFSKNGGKFFSNSAVNISIEKEPDKSTANITKDVLNYLKGRKETDAAGGIGLNYTILSNDGDYIDFMLSNVMSNLLIGGALAIFILLVFLRNLKATLVVGSSILISVVSTFVMMYFSGVTLNVVSMGGLALGIGMLVDNSIVIIENIYRMRAAGKNVFAASIQGAKQVSSAIISSTLTTIVVFAPIIFIEGLTKQIIKDLALTVTFSLIASLVVALTLVPMATSTFLTKPPKSETKAFLAVMKAYMRALNFMLKHKAVPLILILVLFGGAIFGITTMKTELFPSADASSLSLTTSVNRVAIDRYNAGRKADEPYLTYDDVSAMIVDEIFKSINKYAEAIDSVGISADGGLNIAGFSLGSGDLTATVMLVPEKERSYGSLYLIEEFNKYFDDVNVTKGLYTVTAGSDDMMGMLTSGNQTIRIYSSDLDALKQESFNIRKLFYKNGVSGEFIDGLENVTLASDTATEEYRLIIDKKKTVEIFGQMTVGQIYLQVSAALSASSSIHTLRLVESTGSKGEYEVYIYTPDYIVENWYIGRNQAGAETNIYVFNNVDEKNTALNTYYLKNTGSVGTYVMTNRESRIEQGEIIKEWGSLFVPAGGKIPLVKNGNEYTYTELTADKDGLVKETVHKITQIDDIVYNSVTRNEPLDLVTFMVTSENMLDDTAPTKTVPLYRLLDDSCFKRDAFGNILYRDALNTIPVGLVTTGGFDTINHIDRKRCETITFVYSQDADTKSLEKQIADILKGYRDTKMPSSISSLDENIGNPYVTEVFNTLYLILALAIVLIYFVMVAQFQSIKSPFIVMFTIPLAFTGCIFALLMAGMGMSAMAMIGLIVLMGVVVNNGIVFVDYANQLIQAGVPRRLAILRTGKDRLRPILMTALTTIIALLSMAFDTSEAGSMLRPLAVATIGGLTYATFLTLFIVPIIYEIFNKKAKQSKRSMAMRDKDIDVITSNEAEEMLAAESNDILTEFVPQTDLGSAVAAMDKDISEAVVTPPEKKIKTRGGKKAVGSRTFRFNLGTKGKQKTRFDEKDAGSEEEKND